MNNLSGIPIQFLNGVDGGGSGSIFDGALAGRIESICQGVSLGLGMLSGISDEVDLGALDSALYGYLVETRNLIADYPSTVAGYQRSPEDTKKMFDYALRYWNTDKKEEALDRLALLEKRETKSLSGIRGVDVSEEWVSIIPGVEYDPAIFEFDGRDRVRQRAGFWYNVGLAGKLFKKIKKAAKKVVKATIVKPTKAIAKVTKKVVKATIVKPTKAIAKGTVKVAKAVAKGAVKVAKVVGKAIARYNPLSVMARTGLLVALKTNMFGMSTRIAPALMTEEEALREGFNEEHYQKATEALGKVKKIFCSTLKGKESALRKAVLSGKRKKFRNPKPGEVGEKEIAQSVQEHEAQIETEFKSEVAEEEKAAASDGTDVSEEVNGILQGLLRGELGAVVAAGTAVSAAAATPFIVKVWNAVKGLGKKIGSGAKSIVSTTENSDGTKTTVLDKINAAVDTAGKVVKTAQAAKAVIKGNPQPESTASSSTYYAAQPQPATYTATSAGDSKSKLLLVGAGVLAAGAIGYFVYKKRKKT